MGLIIRTAGQNRSRPEIRRDYNSLLKQWEDLRDKTLKSTAPCLIREEASIIKRAIRDLYTKSVEEVLVEGAEGYRTAKAYMKFLMPSHASRVKLHREPVSLFHAFDVEKEIDAMHSPVVPLASGGSLVINPTEALVVVDVNLPAVRRGSAPSRKRRSRPISRRPRRSPARCGCGTLPGLVVIDFIDMDDRRNDATVERRMKEVVKSDRARIQIGRISHFGLMELSRQRLRPSLEEAISAPCPMCNGSGYVRSTESTALHVSRGIESAAAGRTGGTLLVTVPTSIAFHLLNHKRLMLTGIEDRYKVTVTIEADDRLLAPDFRIDTGETGAAAHAPRDDAAQNPDELSPPRRRKRPRRRRRDSGSEAEAEPVKADGQESEDRGRRTGRAQASAAGQTRWSAAQGQRGKRPASRRRGPPGAAGRHESGARRGAPRLWMAGRRPRPDRRGISGVCRCPVPRATDVRDCRGLRAQRQGGRRRIRESGADGGSRDP